MVRSPWNHPALQLIEQQRKCIPEHCNHQQPDIHRLDRQDFPGVPDHIAKTAFGPIISAMEIKMRPMPTPSFTPVMIKGSAPGSAMVLSIRQRLASKFLPTSRYMRLI